MVDLKGGLQEGENFLADFRGVSFQCEMTRVIQHDLGLGIVAPVRFRPGRKKKGIVLTPDRQGRRVISAKEFLELRIETEIALIVADEIELDLGALRPVK